METREKCELQMGFGSLTLCDLVQHSSHSATGNSMMSKGQPCSKHLTRSQRVVPVQIPSGTRILSEFPFDAINKKKFLQKKFLEISFRTGRETLRVQETSRSEIPGDMYLNNQIIPKTLVSKGLKGSNYHSRKIAKVLSQPLVLHQSKAYCRTSHLK